MNTALALGETAEASGRLDDAIEIYRRIADDKHLVSDDVLSRLGAVAMSAGDRKTAAAAYLRVYYEFALTDLATAAASHLATLQDQIVKTGYQQDLGRAAMLFGARRYAEARTAFQEIQRQASGDDRELADLRVAECDFHLKRYDAARDGVRPYLDRASRKAEARFFHLSALRELGQHDEYVAQTRALVADFPGDSWAEEALNNLGTHYILIDEDEAAAARLRRALREVPDRPARRARGVEVWLVELPERRPRQRGQDVRECGQRRFPARTTGRRFCIGRRARTPGSGTGTPLAPASASSITTTATRTTAAWRSDGSSDARASPRPIARSLRRCSRSRAPHRGRQPRIASACSSPTVCTTRRSRSCATRSGSGARVPAIEATIAWAYHQKGELRRAITLMRRAYPQSLTASGHLLPVEMRQVIFPLVYWDLIRKHANAYDLDPYVMAALIAQESTFDPDIRSVANAWGLMQIVPATGRRLARNLGIRRFSTSTLTNPEANIRIGTLYFSQLVRQFGGTYYALASYNAGENRVVRWKAERPGLDEDEFIDDIPFPETQNYVKRILGTAEDYRLLYGRDGGRPRSASELRASDRVARPGF